MSEGTCPESQRDGDSMSTIITCLPSVNQIIPRRDPNENIVVMLLHILKDSLAHAEALFVETFAGSVAVA